MPSVSCAPSSRGIALYHARWRWLAAEATAAAAMAELQERAAGRADLLAGCAGILTGAREGTRKTPLDRCAAGLLIRGRAGLILLPRWIAEGHKRLPRLLAALIRAHRGIRWTAKWFPACGLRYVACATSRGGHPHTAITGDLAGLRAAAGE